MLLWFKASPSQWHDATMPCSPSRCLLAWLWNLAGCWAVAVAVRAPICTYYGLHCLQQLLGDLYITEQQQQQVVCCCSLCIST